MAQLVFLVGKSGMGKSTSLRNLNPEETVIINTDQKALPFKQFGKKYNEATGAISGEPASTTAVVVTTAPWWATTVAGIVTTLGVAYITQTASPAPGETVTDTGGGQGGSGTATRFSQSGLLPILLIGGAAAAYFILKPRKK